MFLAIKYGTEHTKLLHSTLLDVATILPVSGFITVGRMFPQCAQTLCTVPLNIYRTVKEHCVLVLEIPQ